MIPVSTPFSHWSHQRRHSWRNPIAGPGLPVVRKGVGPGPDQALARSGQPREQARHRVRVAVRPAADGVDGRLDLSVVLAHRALPPVVVAALMTEPGLDEGGRALHALEPGAAPVVADRGRVGRLRAQREHRGRPLEHVDAEHAAADVVDVVGVAVVARAHGDDRLERGRPARRHLQAVEAAPRDADHPDGPGAPGLRGQPGDHLERVVLLLRAGTRRAGSRRSRRCRAGRRARRRSRDRRSRGGGTSPAWPIASPLRYGRYSRIAGTGSSSASSGSQMRAASRVPSDIGIQAWSMRRTARGNSVRTLTAVRVYGR